MNFERFRYELQLMGKRVILTPIVVMVCFALFAELLRYLHVIPARFLSAGLEMILPFPDNAFRSYGTHTSKPLRLLADQSH